MRDAGGRLGLDWLRGYASECDLNQLKADDSDSHTAGASARACIMFLASQIMSEIPRHI
jgi:hypothetical protein